MSTQSADAKRLTAARLLGAALDSTARRLEALGNQPRELDLKRELRLSMREAGPDVPATEHKVRLTGWPGVGAADIALLGQGPPVLIELKWGTGTLYNCAWDAAKLACALHEGAASACFMVAGAPISGWSSAIGFELFADGEWETPAFMQRHAAGFAKWRSEVKTRPRQLPITFRSNAEASRPLSIRGAHWELKTAEIIVTPGSPTVSIDVEGHVLPA